MKTKDSGKIIHDKTIQLQFFCSTLQSYRSDPIFNLVFFDMMIVEDDESGIVWLSYSTVRLKHCTGRVARRLACV